MKASLPILAVGVKACLRLLLLARRSETRRSSRRAVPDSRRFLECV